MRRYYYKDCECGENRHVRGIEAWECVNCGNKRPFRAKRRDAINADGLTRWQAATIKRLGIVRYERNATEARPVVCLHGDKVVVIGTRGSVQDVKR